MNRQSKVTLFVICSLFLMKFDYSVFIPFKDNVLGVIQQQKSQTGKQVTEKRELVLPQDAILESHLWFTENEDFKKRINTVVRQAVEERQLNNKVQAEDPHCRDP